MPSARIDSSVVTAGTPTSISVHVTTGTPEIGLSNGSSAPPGCVDPTAKRSTVDAAAEPVSKAANAAAAKWAMLDFISFPLQLLEGAASRVDERDEADASLEVVDSDKHAGSDRIACRISRPMRDAHAITGCARVEPCSCTARSAPRSVAQHTLLVE